MPVTAKICGLSTPDTIAAALSGGASHVGFVFFPASPRHVDFDRAAMLAAAVPGHVGRVGIFVDPDAELVERATAAAGLTAIQLHRATPDKAARQRRPGIETWAAVAVRTRADLAQARDYAGAADRILYDAKTREGSALPGGMGVRFDWNLLSGFAHPLPWALSGGLDAGNVAEAVRITGARLVDISSGVESAPGVKDVDKVARFLQSVAQL